MIFTKQHPGRICNINKIQIALAIVGGLAGIEALIGMTTPKAMKRLWHWLVNNIPKLNMILGAFFSIVSIILWIIILGMQSLSSWLLLFSSLTFISVATICFKTNALNKMLSIWIINRRTNFVRFLYLAEFIIAAILIFVALAQK